IRQRHVENDKDPEVSTTSELFALACGPTWTPISINSCVVDGVRYVVHSRDKRHTTQNNDICSPGPDGEMYYVQLQKILEFKYLLFKIVLFRVKWFDTQNQESKVKLLVLRNNMTQIDTRVLNDLDNATLHIDGQSTEVNAPSNIIDVVDEDDDIIDDEDALPHDLADSDDEDLIDVDDDGVDKMSADVAQSHGGDGEDRPTPHYVPSGCGGCFANRDKGKRKPNLAGRAAGRLNTRDKTRNLSLKEITDTKGLGCAFVPPFLAEGPEGAKGGALADIGEDMRRLEATRTYTDDEINRLARGGKQRGHIPGVSRVLPARATASLNMFSQFETGGASGSGECGDDEEGADDQDDEDEDGDGDT
nr:hypothetical protein [Tanacetum cinerariifolium]